MDANRKTAYLTLMDIELKKSYSNIALNHHIICGKPNSPSFVRELVYGVLENKLLLDYMLGHFVASGITKVKPSDLTVLRMGVYQLGYMDSVPEYAAVNESVLLAKKYCRGREGFINGVLRAYIRERNSIKLPEQSEDPIHYLSLTYSCEAWIVELWLDQYGFEMTEAILRSSQGNPGLTVRINTLKTTKEKLMEQLHDEEFEADPGKVCDRALCIVKGSGVLENKLYTKGLFSVQDESSMKAVEILDPQPGDFVIDLCAAPGGKTLAISERMNNQGKVIATDIYIRKLDIINKEAERLGVSIIETLAWDATKIHADWIGKADKVLADVPCSGLGVIRKKPEIKHKKRSNEMDLLPIKQMDILAAASNYVKTGGILQYSTCTINKQENQKVVKEFLRKNKAFSILEERQFMPHIEGTDGFYVCKMVKSDSLI
ncbi:16S rRNA (cytosine(967)-C(5))-methyltransferase RsmB [Clostridium aminobutyricum]|uniref:16S rRNA (cytosine(967)-C(5))-methyltransferase n=1 Tax=Clostridium aminobutyricum TaxID=33953 RepID=A0A939II20_CLOAM|nr:16S rRNA (cytosine(967)-C(5))-methyltransferase RsmB [Clostridium aminobutyricum]MBN7772049.1 16S rRNA (cytosine(967)-C(5))-methyltransferase RsmB [Clostridium aminobutyricum]